MIWLVSYDIANPKRLNKVAAYCEKFGLRLQKSTFQIDTEKDILEKLLEGLKEIMNRKYHYNLVYPLCADCRRLSMIDGPNDIMNPNEVIFL